MLWQWFPYTSFFFKKNYTSIDDVDFNTYKLTEVDMKTTFVVNQPTPENGTLVFKIVKAMKKNVKLSEAKIEGYSSSEIGNFEMTIVAVNKQNIEQTLKVNYSVEYKSVAIEHNLTFLNLSVSNGTPFELNKINVECTDYNDKIVKRVKLSDLNWKNLDASEVTENTSLLNEATSSYAGVDLSFEYAVGYIGYGNTYFGNFSDVDYSYEVTSFSL